MPRFTNIEVPQAVVDYIREQERKRIAEAVKALTWFIFDDDEWIAKDDVLRVIGGDDE